MEIKIDLKRFEEFKEFLVLNMRLSPRTIQDTVQITRRFLKGANWIVSRESVASYLRGYLNKAPWTYNSQIVALRRFIRDYLGRRDLIECFRPAPIDEMGKSLRLPSRAQLEAGFRAQICDRDRALYLFVALTGLRRGEILALTKDRIDLESRAVIPNHYTRSKRSGITFFNEETEAWLRRYLSERSDDDPRLFLISDRQFKNIWRRASRAAGIKISPKVLRVWFSTEMGERGVPDRYVDIFQGRAPRKVIAKHYTGRELERLKRIYDRAGLKILAP